MRLLMTADTVGGVWTYALQLSRALAPAGVHVDLATMGAPLSTAQAEAARACRNVTVHESTFRLEWMADPWDDVDCAGEWLLRLARKARPDIVHLNGYSHAALPWSAPTLVVGHSCVLSWWRAVSGSDAPDEWVHYRARVAAGLAAADLVVAPTAAFLRELHEHYDFSTVTRVIANGVDPEPQPFVPRDAYGRELVPLRPVILAAGRVWDEAKNMSTLGAAARDIAWPIFVAGSTAHPDGAHRSCDGLNLLGALTPAALRRWYRRAAVFVHPALYEPFGLAPLEAALAHCALVIADLPTLREVWGDAAVYVPPRDPVAIARAVNSLIADPAALSERAHAAHHRTHRFSARRMARAYHETFCRLLSSSASPDTEVLACAS